MGKCLNRGEQTGTQRRRTKQQKIGGGSEEKWCNKSLQSAETKPGQKEHLALHTDIREPVAFCIRKRLLCLHVREWLESICIEVVCDSHLPSLCIPQEKKKDIFLSIGEHARGWKTNVVVNFSYFTFMSFSSFTIADNLGVKLG